MPVFEEYVHPKRAPDRVSDKVPWRAVIAPGVVLQKDRWHTLQRTYAMRGPDAQRPSAEEPNVRSGPNNGERAGPQQPNAAGPNGSGNQQNGTPARERHKKPQQNPEQNPPQNPPQ